MSQVTFDVNVVTMEAGVVLPHEKDYPGTYPTDHQSHEDDVYDAVVCTTTKENSQRSHTSAGSNDTVSNSSGRLTAGSPHLRSNLTRQHKDRDPFTVYERVKLLGSGSMGSVSLVKKIAIGGSARYNAEARAAVEDKYEECFTIPVLGGFFRWILAPRRQADLEKASKSGHTFHSGSSGSSGGNTMDWFASSSETLGMNTSTEDSNTYTSSRQQQQYPLCAMKSIHYNLITDPIFVDELRNEIAVLKTLDHPHVIRVHETYDYQKELFVVMEVCTGGDLYTRDPYTEAEAARITSAILSAVAYMHDRGVIHRDLKFENVLFVNESPTAEIKLIDFGLSTEIKEHEKLDEGAGTITMAPEVIKGEYSKEADLWSVGVITFMLLSSSMPFHGKKRRLIVKQILSGKYEYTGRRWNTVSNQAKAFIDDLLVLEPNDRATAREALMSTWLNRRLAATERDPHKDEFLHVKQVIQRYVKYPRLRKLALMVIAHQSRTEEIGILRKIFQAYDTNKNGNLDFASFKAALHDAGFEDEDYRAIFNAVDVDGSGVIRYTEFLAATMEAAGWISEERLAEAFDRLDHDDTGYISRENLRHMFGHGFPEEEIDLILEETASNDGRGISYEDFLSQWNDDKDEFMKQWSRHMIRSVSGKGNALVSEEGPSDIVSELSFDESVDETSRVNFLQSKAISERKLQSISLS